jgi:hypothetical protein
VWENGGRNPETLNPDSGCTLVLERSSVQVTNHKLGKVTRNKGKIVVVPVINGTTEYECEWESGNMAPYILKLSA